MTEIPAWSAASGWRGDGNADPVELDEGDELRPVLLSFDGSRAQRRPTVALRAIFAVPHYIVLCALSIAAQFVAIVGWVAALFTGRLPDFAADFLGGYLRWQTRAAAYTLLLTDEYPPFSLEDVGYPARVALLPGPLNRLAVFFRLILAIPAAVVVMVVSLGTYTVALFVTWLIVLVTGRMPDPLYQALAAVLRYQTRYAGYLLMLTSAYPSGLFGDQPGAGHFFGPAGGGPGGLGRAGGPGAGMPGDPGVPAGPGAPGGFMAGPGGFAGPVEGFAEEPQDFGAQEYTLPESLDLADAPVTVHGHDGQGIPAAEAGAPAAPGAPAIREAPVTSVAPPGGLGDPGGPALPGNPLLPGIQVSGPGIQAAGPFVAADGPAGPAGALSPWRLVLSDAAKRLVALFLAIGVLVVAGYIILIVVLVAQVPGAAGTATAATRAQAAFAPLDLAMNSFATQTSQCRTAPLPLACMRRADEDLAVRFDTFAAQLRAIPMPSGAAGAAATRLGAAASRGGLIFHRLAAAKTAARYRATLDTVGIDTAMSRFAQDYQALGTALSQS